MLFFLAEEVGAALYLPVTLAFAFLSLEGLKSDKNLLLSSSLACRLFRTLCFFFLFFFSSRDRSWKRKFQIFFTALLNHLHPRIRLGEVGDLCGFSPRPSHKVGHPDGLIGANLKGVCNRGWHDTYISNSLHCAGNSDVLRWLPLEIIFYVVFIQMFLKLQIKTIL